jgi:DUF1365 family protein
LNARLPAIAARGMQNHGRAATGLAVIDGAIMHRRSRPAANAFTYRGFCLRLPLAELPLLPARGVRLNRSGLVSFHEADHGPRDGSPLEPWIRALLRREQVVAEGPVVLYAFPRMLGYVFNPVSFWVCHRADGLPAAVLAEVNNTFGETHRYLLADAAGRPLRDGATLTARKVFHVSPFCDVKGHYAFRFHFGPDRWLARVDYFDGETVDAEPLLATCISGTPRLLDRAAARALPWRYRWFTLSVVARIHWQAARLWMRHVPFFPKPAPPESPLTRGDAMTKPSSAS